MKVSTGKVGKETRQGHSVEAPYRGWKHLEELIEGPGTLDRGLDVVLTCEAAPLSSLCPGRGFGMKEGNSSTGTGLDQGHPRW